ncbi:MAG: hypothetical protein FJ304_18235 [Planctomycetes bacterium]|nr:hypothetical protein [Planctomycetota bacterium]
MTHTMTHSTRRAALAVERVEPRDVPAVADLAVTITDLTVEMPDATVARYQIEVTNTGPDPVTNVTITDDVGAGPPAANALYWTATASGGATVAQPNGFGEFSLGATLPVGGRVFIYAAVQVQRRTSGPLVTTAAVTLGAGDTDPNPGNNTASDTTLVSGRSIPDRGVSLFATGSDAGAPGDVRVYDVPSGQLLYQLVPFPGFGGGVRVATGDVTGDGRDDVIVGAGPGAGRT